MPIQVGAEIRRMEDEEFKARVYDVMRHVFDVHNELGRLFHEKIYQREVAFRARDAQREVPIEVRFDDFSKTYYLDLLIGGGGNYRDEGCGSPGGAAQAAVDALLVSHGPAARQIGEPAPGAGRARIRQ
jgi:hypothetical protein